MRQFRSHSVYLGVLVCLLLPSWASAQRLVMGTGPATEGVVRVLDPVLGDRSFQPYGGFGGGVRVAQGDVNGDGVLDIITGAGPGGGPHVLVFDGATLGVLASFMAYDPAFAGGVFVAAGDVNGDGRADIITGAGAGGGPHVRVFSGVDLSELRGFFAYAPFFGGGVSVAAGDVNGDGLADIVTGPGPSGGPHVRVFNGANLAVLTEFMAYDPAFPGGANVAAGDVNGDGRADIITGAGPGGGPHVQVFDGTTLAVLASYFAYDPAFTGGVTVTAGDYNQDGVVDVITGPGWGGGPHVQVFSGDDARVLASFMAFTSGGGAFVGAQADPGLRVTSAANTSFTVGTPGTFTITTVGSPLPALSVSGTLPAGVTFVDNGDGTATLSGTPAAGTGGVYPLTITATNGVKSATQSFTLTVRQAPAITSGNATTFALGLPGSFTVTTTGVPAPTLALGGALPGGVTFVDNGDGTGTLSGTPAPGTGGSYALTFTATNSAGASAPQAFTLTVNSAPVFTSAAATTFALGEAGSFTVTTVATPPATLSVGALPGGVTFVDNLNGTGTLSGTPASGTAGPHTLTFTATNGVGGPVTQTFTLTIIEGPVITSASSATFAIGGTNSFTVTASGFPFPTLVQGGATLPSGVTWVDNSNGTGTLSGTPAAGTGGDYSLTFTASNVKGSAVQNFTLTVSGSPGFTSPATATFTVGTPGSFTVTAIGAPTPALTVSGALPSGVMLVDNGDGTGTLSGTPAAGTGGVHTLTFTAANGVLPDGTQTFTLNVNEGPVITSAASATLTIGAPNSFTVTTSGLPLPAIAIGGAALPAGVTFVDNGNGTGTLSGTPAAGTGGIYAISFTATNALGASAPQAFTLTVSAPPTITSVNTTTFTVSTAGSFTVTATGSPTPTISVSGALPAGVTFIANADGTGTLSGTPAAGTGGVYALAFTAANGVLPDATQAFTLNVNQAPVVTSAASTTFTVGTPGSFTVTTSGFPAPTLAIGGAALPAGVTFTDNGNGTGTLSGTPDADTGGTYAISFTATNTIGTSAVQAFTLTVNQGPAITSANSTSFLVGAAGTFTVTTTGFPAPTIARTGAALPAGVTFVDNGDGTATLSGTPAAGTAGAYAFTFTATNSTAPSATQAFTLNVNAPPAITSPTSTTFTVGTPGTFTVVTTGFPAPTVSQTGALPTGVTFTAGTRVLAGTATQTGAFPLVFTAANGVPPDATQNFTLNVVCPAITVNPTTLPDGLYQVAYGGVTFTQTGSTGSTTTWSATGLPPGLSIGPTTGAVSGTPTNTVANGAVVITATDNFGCTGTRNTMITVRPVADAETYINGVGNTQYVVGTAVPATPHVLNADLNNTNVKMGDNGPGTLTVTFPGTSLNGGAIADGAVNGTFIYTPPVGVTGADSFIYTLTDGNGVTNTATVTINMSNIVWYVNSSGGNGDGRSHSPFNSLANAATPSLSNSYIYIHTGGATTPGNLTMDASQTLQGQGATFSLNGLTILGGTRPTLSGTVTLANNTVVTAVNFTPAGIPAMTASGVTLPVAIDQVNVTGGTNALSLTNVSGAVTVTNATFTNTTGAEVLINQGTGSVAVGATISSNAGRSIDIQNRTGGTVSFIGAITDTGQGIFLNANTGTSTFSFTGALSLSTGTSPAFTATNSGTVSNSNAVVNTIVTTTGTALTVANTVIGAGGLTFRSIASNGAVNGILLNATGAGGLTVTGNSAGLCGGQVANSGATVTAPVAADCSGGAILASTGAGVSLTGTGPVSLTRMRIANSGDDGIIGSGVGGLTLTSSLLESNGNAVGDRGIDIINLTGSGGMTNSTVRGSAEHNVIINNTSGTLSSFNVTNSQVGSNSIVTGDDGILLLTDGAANITASVTQSAFTDNKGDHFQAATTASATGTINVTFSNNTLLTTAANDPNVIGGGITISPSGSADLTFTIANNNIQQAFDDAINLNLGTASTAAGSLIGTISNNTIGTAADANSGSESSNTITVTSNGAGSTTVAVTNNVLRQYGNGHGILIDNKEGSAMVNATVTGNNIDNPGTFAINGIHVSAGATAGPPADNGTTCAAITGNSVTNAGLATADIRLRQRFSTTIRLPGYAGAADDTTAVNSFVSGNNGGAEVTSIHNVGGGGNGYLGGAACTLPQ